ncbi:MAG TPA: hypothetical protein VFQ47_01185 [Nitrososphaera sp.]|jgi:hypothetical protein|nr:hypothetical protein [Nitrososphaera sp.]
MEITEPHGSRFELALELFQDGRAFTFDDVGFWLAPDGALEVRVQTSWYRENVTEQTALNDLERAKNLADFLERASPEFASLVKDRPRRYVLVDDYKMGGIELCRLIDGSLFWSKGFPMIKGTT